MSGPFGGGNDVTIGVGANVNDFTQGTRNASDAWAQFAQTVTQQNAAIQSSLASLNSSFASFSQSFQSLNLGQQSFQKETENTHSAISNNLIGGFTKFAFSVNQVMDFFRNGKEVLVGFVDTLTKIPSAILSIPWSFLSQNLAGFPSSLGAVPNAAVNEAWNLNVGTEKNLGAWRFLYGNGGLSNTPDPTVQKLMGWTSDFSFNIPYTRQDLINSITALGRMGLTSQQVQQFMPTVADLGVLNPNRDLTQAAFAIQGAMHGYTRMLRYDYGIDPRQLEPFGLKITGMDTVQNPDQLLPALQKWEQARGLSGSAKWASQNTWWGEWSSFQDRIQNLLLELGGTDPTNGNIRQGSLFGRMKDDLKNLTGWMDNTDNKKVLFEWADAFQNALGGGVKFATNAVQGFFKGLQESGAGNVVFDGLKAFGSWINSPQTSAALQHIGEVLGEFGGPVLQTAGGAIQGFLSGFMDSGAVDAVKGALQGLGKWFSDPQHQKDIKDFGKALGQLAGDIVTAATKVGQALAGAGDWFSTNVWNPLQGALNAAGTAMSPLITGSMSDSDLRQLMQNGNVLSGKMVNGDQMSDYQISLEKDAAKEYFARIAKILGESDADVAAMYQRWLDSQKGPMDTSRPLVATVEQAEDPLWRQSHKGYFTAYKGPETILARLRHPLAPSTAQYNAEVAKQQAAIGRLDAGDDAYLNSVLTSFKGAVIGPTQAKTDAQTYLQAFDNAIVDDARYVGQIAKSFSQKLQQGFQDNSSGFATALTNAITAVSQQVVNATLANYTAAANAGARAPGGTRTGRYQPGVS